MNRLDPRMDLALLLLALAIILAILATMKGTP